MARTTRALLPEGPFHVMSHAIDGQRLFRRDVDFRRYIGLLQLAIERHRLTLFSFVLMGNHVHLLVRAVPSELSAALWFVNWRFAEAYKRDYRPRMGHVFSGRPKIKAITTDAYFLAVTRYIALNPARPATYPWGAHRAILGRGTRPPLLAADELLRWFGSVDAYARFVHGSDPEEHRDVRRWSGNSTQRPSLELLVADPTPAALLLAHDHWDYSTRAIAAAAGMSRSTVQRRINAERSEPGGQAPRLTR